MPLPVQGFFCLFTFVVGDRICRNVIDIDTEPADKRFEPTMTNYYERPETGKVAHQTFVRLANLFHESSMER